MKQTRLAMRRAAPVDRHKLLIGASLFVMLLGALLLCFTHSGLFNPVIPYSYKDPMSTSPSRIYHPERAYIDLSESGPLTGMLAILAGAGGLVYAYARRANSVT
jgi:hypothetical protein